MSTEHTLKREQDATEDDSSLETYQQQTDSLRDEDIEEHLDQLLLSQPECAKEQQAPLFSIKTEEAERSLKETVDKQENEPDVGQPYSYCKECRHKYASNRSYRYHMRAVHNIEAPNLHKPTKKRNSDITPDIHDPNNYCSSCDKTYNRKYYYRFHLKSFHHITLQPVSASPPDPLDPNLYCSQCAKKYKSLSTYRFHLKTKHKMQLRPRSPKKQEKNLVEKDPDYYNRRACAKKFLIRKQDYFNLRKSSSIPLQQQIHYKEENEEKEKVPPVNHCSLCGTYFAIKRLYWRHLKLMHRVKTPVYKNTKGRKAVLPATKIKTTATTTVPHSKKRKAPSAATKTTATTNAPSYKKRKAPSTATKTTDITIAPPSTLQKFYSAAPHKFYCNTCNLGFTSKDEYWSHLDLAHFKTMYGVQLK